MAKKEMVPRAEPGTALETWRPFEDMRSFVETMDRAFEDMWSPYRGLFGGARTPAPRGDGGLEETPKEFIVTVPLPGMEKDDIRLDVTDDTVTVRAERRVDRKQKGERSLAYGSMMRSFTLPAPVKSGEAKARYKDGVLKVELPKVRETKSRRIEIQ